MKTGLIKKTLKALLLTAPLALAPLACGEKSSSDDETTDEGFGTANQNVTMTGTLNLTNASLLAATHNLYCVTFEATPSSSNGPMTFCSRAAKWPAFFWKR